MRMIEFGTVSELRIMYKSVREYILSKGECESAGEFRECDGMQYNV